MIWSTSLKFPMMPRYFGPSSTPAPFIHTIDMTMTSIVRPMSARARRNEARRVIRPFGWIQYTKRRMTMMMRNAVPKRRPISASNSDVSAKRRAKENAVPSAPVISTDWMASAMSTSISWRIVWSGSSRSATLRNTTMSPTSALGTERSVVSEPRRPTNWARNSSGTRSRLSRYPPLTSSSPRPATIWSSVVPTSSACAWSPCTSGSKKPRKSPPGRFFSNGAASLVRTASWIAM